MVNEILSKQADKYYVNRITKTLKDFSSGKFFDNYREILDNLKAFKMDSRQYGLLVKVYEKPNMSQIQIAQELKIDRTTMAERAE